MSFSHGVVVAYRTRLLPVNNHCHAHSNFFQVTHDCGTCAAANAKEPAHVSSLDSFQTP